MGFRERDFPKVRRTVFKNFFMIPHKYVVTPMYVLYSEPAFLYMTYLDYEYFNESRIDEKECTVQPKVGQAFAT